MKHDPSRLTAAINDLLVGTTWPYQEDFKDSVEWSAKRALEEVGFLGNVSVEIITLRWQGGLAYDVCMDSARSGERNIGVFLETESRAKQHWMAHPRRDLIQSHPAYHERQQRDLDKSVRGQALCDLLAVVEDSRRVFFASYPVDLDDQHQVYVILGLNRDEYDKVPHLKELYRDITPLVPSLVYAIVRTVLRWASRGLQAGKNVNGFDSFNLSAAEISRGAADDFVASLFYCAGQLFGAGVVEKLNAISALPYEGRSSVGRIVIGRKGRPEIKSALEILSPVALAKTRAARKLVEASGSQIGLLSDGEYIYGFGELSDDEYDASSESVFTVSIDGRGSWSIAHIETLLAVQDGFPKLPKLPLDESYLREAVDRVLGRGDADVLVALAKWIGRPDHGAMLVVSSSAAEEADRLRSQAWKVAPIPLSEGLAGQLVDIDGAILVDLDGLCHGIGVILDGPACGYEDPARGSRYNNAVRYALASDSPPAVIIVYSSDGSVDVLPRLLPRVRREDVAAAVDNYEREVETYISKPVDEKERAPRAGVARARDRVVGFAFYLSADQCRRTNAARKSVSDYDYQHSSIQIVEPDLKPDPRMNDEYFLAPS